MSVADPSLVLHFHPLSSYCQKALVALYENETPFRTQFLDLGDAAVRAQHQKLWPFGKMPVLRDEARDRSIPEATIVIEYLAVHYPGKVALVPDDRDQAVETRLRDRFFDLYMNEPLGKVVADKFRPEGRHDPHGVEQARQTIATAYDLLDATMKTRTWAIGEAFTMADCAAAPALFYLDKITPLARAHPHAAAYLARLRERPSFARVVKEAEPYMALFPG